MNDQKIYAKVKGGKEEEEEKKDAREMIFKDSTSTYWKKKKMWPQTDKVQPDGSEIIQSRRTILSSDFNPFLPSIWTSSSTSLKIHMENISSHKKKLKK